MKDYTFIYSSNSIDSLKELFKELDNVFGNISVIDDLFYYGVFCKPETYANYEDIDRLPINVEYPSFLQDTCKTEKERVNYVKAIIEKIITGQMDKPEWMTAIEEIKSCAGLDFPPSNFLFLKPKKNSYRNLASCIINFLYSPNLIITMI